MIDHVVTVAGFFFCARAPYLALSHTAAITSLVRRALNKAGIESTRKGAHLFRHSLATDMLRHGASLNEIGELLRHQSPNSTAVYAKVELTALRPLALSWPGGAQ
jgi:site-specific recombinase XerD